MASVSASGSRRARILAGAASALLASCSALEIDPGGDFGVRILIPTPIPAAGRISVPVHIAVTGCAAFHAAVSAASGSHPVDVVRDGDGWVADVPVEWIRGQDTTCLRGSDAAISRAGRLDVTCDDAGRTASAGFEISYATADVFYRAWGGYETELRYLFPSDDPLHPYAVSPSWLQPWADLDPRTFAPLDNIDATSVPLTVDVHWQLVHPLSRFRLAATPKAIFVTSGCGEPSGCPGVEVAPGIVAPSEQIWAVNLDPQASLVWWYAWVPKHVVDIGFAPDGALVVVSHVPEADLGVGSPFHNHYDTIVTRIAASPPTGGGPTPYGGVAVAEVIGYFPTDVVQTRLSRLPDGRLAFLTTTLPNVFFENVSHVLNATDGRTVERVFDVADAIGDIRPMPSLGGLSLSPDASLLLYGNALGPPGGSGWTALPADHVWSFGDGAGAAWGAGVLAMWHGAALGSEVQQDSGIVEAFDLFPPNGRLFRYDVAPLPAGSSPVALNGVVAVGDHFVLTTSTGVRVLDRRGKVVAGSDPLPCRMSPSAVAIQTGPDQAAVGVGEHGVLVFDLSKL